MGELHISFVTINVMAGQSGWSLELKFIVRVRLKTKLGFVQIFSCFVRQRKRTLLLLLRRIIFTHNLAQGISIKKACN